jgi:hypothetical protein
MTYEKLINNIQNNVQFSFSRFGDGELNCMYGKTGANCDGHIYFDDLGQALTKAWNNPRGIIAMQRYGYEMYKGTLGDNIWANADIIHKASINGDLDKFRDVLNDKRNNIILVAPARLKPVIPCRTFIDVPLKNAWKQHDYILERLKFHVQKWDIIIYCCGMMAEVLIHDMYDQKITQIDAGSVFDPYCGVKSRNYHHKLKM